MSIRYPLTFSSWGQEEIKALHDTIASDRFTMGDKVRLFEESFARQVGARYAVMTNSGSSANLIAIASLFYKKDRPLKAGDEVLVPAVSWSTTYSPLQQFGLKLKFVDIDPQTLNVDFAKLEQAVTENTKMIVAVSILGNPADLDKMRKLCDQRGIYFFEDNCESMGAEIDGRQAGTFGDLGTFSCFYSHHISTMEGGVVVTDDEKSYHLLRALRAHGWTRDLPQENTLAVKGQDDFFEAYRFIVPGYNVRPLELSGAVGLEQLKKFPRLLQARKDNARYFQQIFKENPLFQIQRENHAGSWYCFTLTLKKDVKVSRKVVLSLLKEAGIEYRIVTGGNFVRHEAIKFFNYEIHGDLKNADWVHDNGFFVGNAPYDIRDKIDYLAQVLKTLE